MRGLHKTAALARHDAALELVLEHHRGAEILAASGGDAEHALRIIEELKQRAPSAQVIRLPREPILDFNEVLSDVDDDSPASAPFPFVLAIALGLAVWVAVAAIAFVVYELVQRA
jgi:hypothetical protein